MTDPIEKMVEARNAEWPLWYLYTNYPEETRWWALREVPGHTQRVEIDAVTSDRANFEFDKLRNREAMRAAVLALAEAEPTREMFDAWGKEENECAVHNYGGHPSASTVFSIGCRAAAEQKKEQD